MSRPQRAAEIRERIAADRARLESLIEGIDESRLTQPGVQEGWSIKDVLAHVTWWEQRMLTLLASARRGERPESLVRPGEAPETVVDRVNADVLEASRAEPLAAVIDAFRRSGANVAALTASLGDDELADDSAVAQALGGPPAELIAVNTYEHYREHEEMIAAWLARHDA
jgi:uncharacterized protein (TIGR03083 family)